MKCTAVRDLLFRKIDNELSDSEKGELEIHLAGCASCTREYRILNLPGRMAREIPRFEPSPFFFQKLRMRLDGETQKAAGWQVVLGLARQVIPALAGITLALLSVFAYFEVNGNEVDLHKAYDRVFISADHPHRMLISEQGEITDEAVLSAIAEGQSNQRRSLDIR